MIVKFVKGFCGFKDWSGMRVVIAPDSFKGSISNFDCAKALADGWLTVRPSDQVLLKPMADGGEGTLETVGANNPSAIRMNLRGTSASDWLLLEDGTAVVELAKTCGITLLSELDPMGSNTFALGSLLHEAAQYSGVKRIVVAVGGSASTDGGVGALVALGARILNSKGAPVSLGGLGLREISTIDISKIVKPPVGGVTCLVDVENTLLGPQGSARIFSPQKGATSAQVLELEKGLENLMEKSGADDFPGAGAAGGTPFGISLGWKISLESGARTIAKLMGLPEAIGAADLVITGEGRLDAQSFNGKVVGEVRNLASKFSTPIFYCVGSNNFPELDGIDPNNIISLVDIAPSLQEAISEPTRWLRTAGAYLAGKQSI